VKNDNGDLLADSHNILNRWKKYFSQFVHRISDVKQTEIHTAELLVHDPSPFDAIAKLKIHKSPASDQIPAELTQAGSETLQSEIHKLINSIWSKEELLEQWKESITVTIYKNGDETDYSNYQGISLLSGGTQ
jgi:mannosyltransferase OCH1-like enzyme